QNCAASARSARPNRLRPALRSGRRSQSRCEFERRSSDDGGPMACLQFPSSVVCPLFSFFAETVEPHDFAAAIGFVVVTLRRLRRLAGRRALPGLSSRVLAGGQRFWPGLIRLRRRGSLAALA